MLHAISLSAVLLGTWLLLSGYFTPLLISFGVLSLVIVICIAWRMDVIDHESHPVHLTWRIPAYWISFALIFGLPLLVMLVTGVPITWEMPELRGFNFRGGITVIPEFLALWFALSIYTASFIAEIVRSGIQAISHGQTEAAQALSLPRNLVMRLVVIPQALRVIIPPLTSQYLNLIKNSSLATAIGYPDLVSVFAGTTLNQTGQAIEVIAMTMAVYLTISLLVSMFMNWFNARVALVER